MFGLVDDVLQGAGVEGGGRKAEEEKSKAEHGASKVERTPYMLISGAQ
jgi:hypothetical protein